MIEQINLYQITIFSWVKGKIRSIEIMVEGKDENNAENIIHEELPKFLDQNLSWSIKRFMIGYKQVKN